MEGEEREGTPTRTPNPVALAAQDHYSDLVSLTERSSIPLVRKTADDEVTCPGTIVFG
jgi:hypothetical protein